MSPPSGRIIGRPLNLLFPVEVFKNTKEYPVKDVHGSVSAKAKTTIRQSVREAAKQAQLKIKECLSE